MAISNSGVGIRPGVCTSTTRPTAPYEGQHIYETDTDIEYVWSGTAWVVNYVSANSPAFTGTPTAPTASAGTNTTQLATTAFANTAGGLVFIKSQTIGSGVSSVTVSDAFSSTYEDYKIRITGGAGSSVGFLALQLNNSSTGYFAGYVGSTYNAGAFVGDYNNNATKWTIAGGHTTVVLTMNMDLWQPFISVATWMQTGVMFLSNAYGTAAGENSAVTSHTGFIITPQSGTLTGGTITVYGYRKA